MRLIVAVLAFSLVWVQISPAFAMSHAIVAETARQAAYAKAHMPHVGLPKGETATPNAALRAKIDAKEAAAHVAPDIIHLTAKQMRSAHGRGSLRNPYLNGLMPWQRSVRGANVCTGDLFKNFTDIQVSGARGAGLVLSRSYNSDDARVGPFGVGWTHAYDIRIEEAADVKAEVANGSVDGTPDNVPSTDFFGGKDTYHRDADGLYSPPGYMFDETSSDYDTVLSNGPTKVMADTEKGEDGTIKHYINVVTKADGTEANVRACDYIQDRHGNTTNLTYGMSYVQPDGSTRKLLTQVTDPSNRSLVFTWTNLGTTSQPAYRITQVQGPYASGQSVPGVTYRVVYSYFTDPAEPNAANDLYNLKSVTLDPDGLNRTTNYTYTGYSDTNGTENALLASISDPLNHTVSYGYTFSGKTNTVWVTSITEPGGIAIGGAVRSHVWTINPNSTAEEIYILDNEFSAIAMQVAFDNQLRLVDVSPEDEDQGQGWSGVAYDANNNVVNKMFSSSAYQREDAYTYGAHGNQLTHAVMTNGDWPAITRNSAPFPGTETNTWFDSSQYFQQSSATDMNGRMSTTSIGNSTDANTGNRGSVLWTQDPGYSDSTSPSYQKQTVYTYNQYGQKLTETNLNGVVTQYTYGDVYGNLTQIVQDPGTGHLNRTTTMAYDAAGRVLQTTDPTGLTSTVTYNTLGQPLTTVNPARGSNSAETITYAYDLNGRALSVQDNRGVTWLTYEAGSDRVHSVTDPVTGTTSYTYGLLGETLTTTLAGGGTWTYGYVSYPTGTTSSGLHVMVPGDDPDKMGFVLGSITDDQGRKIEYNFDARGVLKSTLTNEVYNGGGTLVGYAETDYKYDTNASNTGHGWLAQMTNTWNQYRADYPVMSHRLISQNSYTYDNVGNRLTNTIVQESTNASGGATFVGGTPQYDSNNNVTNQITTTRIEKYQKQDGSSGYDALNRLTNVDYGDGQTQSYSFDPMGNRLGKQDSVTGSTTYAYNAANMLLSTSGVGASTYTNDADGNTLTGGGRTNTWDSQNRMVSCSTPGNSSTFKYGTDRLRRQKTTNGVTTDYSYDSTMMVREGHASGGSITPTVTYFCGARGPEYRRDDTATELDSQGRTVTKARWYVYDGLGSVVGELDTFGNLTSSPKYDVYGNVRTNTGNPTTKHGFVGSLGHLSEAETGLIYMRARYCDPNLGRFMSQDPAMQGMNWFVYCGNNPVNNTDSTGLFWGVICGSIEDAVQTIQDAAVGSAIKGRALAVVAAIDAKMVAEQAMFESLGQDQPDGQLILRYYGMKGQEWFEQTFRFDFKAGAIDLDGPVSNEFNRTGVGHAWSFQQVLNDLKDWGF